MSQQFIQLHPHDRQLLEKIWQQSVREAKAVRRNRPRVRYIRSRASRRRKDLLTYVVDSLIDCLVWLLGKLIKWVILGLEWLAWQLAGLILKLFTSILGRFLGLRRKHLAVSAKNWR